MTKQDHIEYWKSLSIRDMGTADYNVTGGYYVPALFFYHLAIEKLLKAHWVKDNVGNTPPFFHDLQKIVLATKLKLDTDSFDYLFEATSWNIEARYPDYKDLIYQKADERTARSHQQKIKTLHQWLLSKL